MQEIQLLRLDRPTTEELLADPAAFARRHDLRPAGQQAIASEMARQLRQHVWPRGADPRWWGYLAIDRASRALVGSCGFCGPPDRHGQVEISYFTFPPHEGRGYATAMARRLLRLAFAAEGVTTVLARTAPQRNASARLLERLGFVFAGERDEPPDGPVWRHLLSRAAHDPDR